MNIASVKTRIDQEKHSTEEDILQISLLEQLAVLLTPELRRI
jgi:hypothetical protein